jgi:predicted ATPase/class 3 adenylate cyclase
VTDRFDLPTGTVTFLFTDIEGSTRLLQRLGAGYPKVLENHQRLLREVFAARGGTVVGTEGDSFFVVFSTAPEALSAAVEAQRALEGHQWPEGGRVRVRMGLHTGEGTLGGDSYVGVDVHRAARIVSAGHGGQLLMSESTWSLVQRALPEGATVRDLGYHRLRDLEQPERLYHVLVQGLPADFPPIRSDGRRLGNLPTPLSTFVGRGRELQELKALLARSRLVTLTGPGGTGKTRLALRAAGDLQSELEDGAFFVRLAGISDPELVTPTMAEVLGIPEDPGRPPIEMVIEYAETKDLLLVLDNFEQVLSAADGVGEILENTDRVRALVTSREPLGLQGEHEYPVHPLKTPDLTDLPPPARLTEYEAVALFVERASAVDPGFQVTGDNAAAIAEICIRLDGLPLAIELAAARTRLLGPHALLARLERRLPLLAGGARDLPARQRTLRDAISWSHDLLDDRDRTVFASLSVFVGGFTLEAAEAVCQGEIGDTFEGVGSLMNKSLLRQMDAIGGKPRFFMLETIREYAADQLADRGENEEVERRHAEHFVAQAEQAEPELTGSRQTSFLDALAADHDNFRVALDRAASRGWAEVALRLGAALWRFWQIRGYLREGRDRLGAVLALPGADDNPEARIRALWAAGGIAYWMGDFPASEVLYEEAERLSRQIGDRPAVAESLYNLAFPLLVGEIDEERGREQFGEAARIFQELGDRGGRGKVLWAMSGFLPEEADEVGIALATEALEIFRETGDRFHEGWAVRTLGIYASRVRLFDEAWGRLSEGLEIFRDAGDVPAIVTFLGSFTDLAVAEGDVQRALRLAGARAELSESTGEGISQWLGESEERRRLAERCESDADSARLWAEGRAMSLEEAVAYALRQQGAGVSSLGAE